ncbi:hypothetical protein, partial [Aquabacterium humicola]|uniref:hypothetical protein n=1 Tax=Aquabacterium humicola TaxID=3237377 RepID=UPI002543EE36
MTAIIGGGNLGLFNTSADVLGMRSGSGAIGRTGSDTSIVNVSNGNVVIQSWTDEFLASKGLGTALMRSYNSRGLLNDDNGDNWQLDIARLIGDLDPAGSVITRQGGDGGEATFTKAGNVWLSDAGGGAQDMLEFSAGQWTFTDGTTRIVELFDAAGRLIARENSDGLETTYVWDTTTDLLQQISDASGQTITLAYNSGANYRQLAHISILAVPAGGGAAVLQTRTWYEYDAQNRLARVKLALDGAGSKFWVTDYTYKGNTKLVETITQGDGTPGGVSCSASFGYYADGRVLFVTDGENNNTSFSYVTDAQGTITTVTDALNQTTSYWTDTSGRLREVKVNSVGGALTTSYEYDGRGNVTKVTDANGRVTESEYDAKNNLTLRRDELGNTVTFTYDARNQLLNSTQFLVPDADGSGSAAQPGEPRTTRQVYDAAGEAHVRFVVSAEGEVIEYRYNAAGQRTATLRFHARYNLFGLGPMDTLSESQLAGWASTQWGDCSRTDVEYDPRGLAYKTTEWDEIDASTGEGVGNGQESISYSVYDQRGNLLQFVAAGGVKPIDGKDPNTVNATTYTYDGLGRMLSVKQWVQAGIVQSELTTTYNDFNGEVLTTSASGVLTTSVHDMRGLLLSQTQSASGTGLGAVSYKYDKAGLLRWVQDQLGNRTYYLYDESGRRVATIDHLGGLTELAYDGLDLVRQTSYAKRLSTSQLVSLVNADGDPATVQLQSILPQLDTANDREVRTEYDAAHRITRVLTAVSANTAYVTEYLYDGAGRLTDIIVRATAVSLTDPPAIVPTSVDDRHSRQFWDGQGRQTGVLDAEGYLTLFEYGVHGLKHTVRYATAVPPALRAGGSLQQLKDAASDAASPTAADHQHEYIAYDNKGRMRFRVDAEGYLTEYARDGRGNVLVEKRWYNKANPYTGVQTLSQTRPAPHGNDAVTTSTYDGANRLRTVTAQGITKTFAYDDAGRLIKVLSAVATSEERISLVRHDALGRVTHELSAKGARILADNPGLSDDGVEAVWAQHAVKHHYDIAGRRIGTTDQNGNKTRFYYDQLGQLRYTIDALGLVREQRYNSFGQASDSVEYAKRLSAVNLAALDGGQIDATVSALVNALANASFDRHDKFEYTRRGELAKAVDALGNAQQRTYGAFVGEVSSALTLPAAQGKSVLTTFAHDHRGLLKNTVQDADFAGHVGAKRSLGTVYDAFGRVQQTLDGNLIATNFKYDRLGRTVTVTDANNKSTGMTYDAFSRVLTVKDALQNTTTYVYDDSPDARSYTVTTAENITTKTVFNRHGQVFQVKDGNGITTTNQYDDNGGLHTQTVDDGGLNLTTVYGRDDAGRLISVTSPEGIVTTIEYDAANREIKRTVDPTGLNLVTTITIDDAQRKVRADAGGVVRESSFNALGQLVQTCIDPDGLQAEKTTYTYDDQGRTLTVTTGDTTVEHVYNHLGWLIERHVDPAGLNLTTTYAHDQQGNVISSTDATGKSTRYYYDNLNRLIYTLDPLKGLTRNQYDALGRVTEVRSFAQAFSGLPSNASIADIEEMVPQLADARRDWVQHAAYDKDGRQTHSWNALGEVISYAFDKQGRVVKTTLHAQAIDPDTADIVLAIAALPDGDQDRVSQAVYNAAGWLIYQIDALGLVTGIEYDDNGLEVRRTAFAEAIAPTTLDNVNGVAQRKAAVEAALDQSDAKNRVSQTVFDSAGRLIYGVDAAGYVTSYVRDESGAVVRTGQFSQPIAAGVLGGLTDRTQRQQAIETALQGKTEARWSASVYDSAHRLAYSTDSTWQVTSYAYDDRGNITSSTRWAKPLAVGTVLDAQHVSQALIGSDSDRTRRTLFDAANRAVLAVDERGSVTRNILDASGRVVEQMVFAEAYDGENGWEVDDVLSHLNAVQILHRSEMVYDAAGRLAYAIDELGNATRFSYDALGNRIGTIARAKAPTGVVRTAEALDAFFAVAANQSALDRESSSWTLVGSNGRTYSAMQSAAGDMTLTVSGFDKTEVLQLAQSVAVAAGGLDTVAEIETFLGNG